MRCAPLKALEVVFANQNALKGVHRGRKTYRWINSSEEIKITLVWFTQSMKIKISTNYKHRLCVRCKSFIKNLLHRTRKGGNLTKQTFDIITWHCHGITKWLTSLIVGLKTGFAPQRHPPRGGLAGCGRDRRLMSAAEQLLLTLPMRCEL